MRLMLIASFAGSIVSFRGELIKALVNRGIDVTVAAPGLTAECEVCRQLESIGARPIDISLQRTGRNPFRDLASLLTIYKLIRTVRPDIVLAYTIKPVIYGSLAAWMSRVPRRFALITGLGNAVGGSQTGSVGIAARILYRLALASVSKVFFQNPDDESFMRAERILHPDTPSVVVNGSGVDLKRFRMHPVPAGAPRFLMIARLIGDKGVREYARAAEIVKSRYKATTFALAGWIDDNPDAISQNEVDEWVEKGTIEFLGHLSDVRPAIAACSVYVLPSRYGEGTPRTVLEAMSTGRAILTSDAPGCRETVVNGRNGYLVTPGSATELAAAMCKFVEDRDLAVHMGHCSREIAEYRYDVHKVNAVMLSEMSLH